MKPSKYDMFIKSELMAELAEQYGHRVGYFSSEVGKSPGFLCWVLVNWSVIDND